MCIVYKVSVNIFIKGMIRFTTALVIFLLVRCTYPFREASSGYIKLVSVLFLYFKRVIWNYSCSIRYFTDSVGANSFFAFPLHRGGWPFSLLYSTGGFYERNNYFYVNDDNRAIITFTALRWYDITVVRY